MADNTQSDETAEPSIYDRVLEALTYEYGRRNIRNYDSTFFDVYAEGMRVEVECYDDIVMASCRVKDENGDDLEFGADEVESYALELARLPLMQPSIFSLDGERFYARHSTLIDPWCIRSPGKLISVIESLLMTTTFSSYSWSIRKSMESEDGDVAESIDPAIESEND